MASAPAGFFRLLVYDPFQMTKIYAATSKSSILQTNQVGDEFWTSSNNGLNWDSISLLDANRSPVFVSLYPDPAASGVLFAGIAFVSSADGRRDVHFLHHGTCRLPRNLLDMEMAL